VTDDKLFRERVQRIGALVQEIEAIADPALRTTTKELVQLIMELHGTGLERMMELTFQAGDPGSNIIDEFGRDPRVSSLLVLHGLHPETLQARVLQALDRIRPGLRKQGSEVELLAVDEGAAAVRIKIDAGGHACGSTSNTLRSTVEEAVYELAPDVTSLSIEGLDGLAASGFVALDTLMSRHLPVAIAGTQVLAARADGAD
jgi:Fe-S cluster biogenesis protein NfuA